MRFLWFLAVALCVSTGCDPRKWSKEKAKENEKAKESENADAKAEAKPEAKPEAKLDEVASDKPARKPIAITGISECDEFIGLGVALMDCLPERRATMLPMFQQMIETAHTALADEDQETREAFRSLCKKNVENVLAPGGGTCPLVIPERDYTAELQLEAELHVGVASLEHCTAYVDALDKLLGCDRLSADTRVQLKDRHTETLDALSHHEGTLEAERIRLDGLCWDTLETVRTSMPALGCPL
jgi:hypothetical protein